MSPDIGTAFFIDMLFKSGKITAIAVAHYQPSVILSHNDQTLTENIAVSSIFSSGYRTCSF